MTTQAVPPLRVQKTTNQSSPTKGPFVHARPLSELSPMALRRNSPSFPKGRDSLKHESPSATSSPFGTSQNSPRLFWQGRDPNSPSCENRNPLDAMSPIKRSSIENLKRASRVKNSSMFAREQKTNYDPSRPSILDGKPLGAAHQGNAFGGKPVPELHRHSLQLPQKLPMHSDDSSSLLEDRRTSDMNLVAPLSPSKSANSPAKSSLSKRTGANFRRSGFDPVTGIWEDDDDEEQHLPDGRRLRRHAKSVTFDQAPPQINEYEMTTPDPSSVASGSREGSYESFDDEEDEEYSYDRGSSMDHDDSFDASLEDAEKTPVVLPEDWRFMSPEIANTDLARHHEDVFTDDDLGSPPPTAKPDIIAPRNHQTSVTSVDSNGQTRPLPPLPPSLMGQSQRDSLSGTLERMSGSYRSLPSPPQAASISKDDLRRMSAGSLSLEERMKLMMLKDQDQDHYRSDADVQRERRMRRATSKESSPIRDQFQAAEGMQQQEVASPSSEDRKSRRLSRDLIVSQLRGLRDEDESADELSPSPSQMHFDPDVAIPSREDPTQKFDDEEEDEVIIKQEPIDDDELYAIPEMYRKTSSQMDTDDETSQYSQPSVVHAPAQEPVDGAETPRATSPARLSKDKSMPSERMSLPDFMDFGHDQEFGFGLAQYISAGDREQPKVLETRTEFLDQPLPDLAALRSEIQRPYTPEGQLEPPRPAYADEDLEPGTPESVIRHRIEKSVSPEDEEYSDISAISTEADSIQPEPAELISPMSTHEDLPPPPPAKNSPPPPEVQISAPVEENQLIHDEPEAEPVQDEAEVKRSGPRVSSLVQLDFPRDTTTTDLGLGLEKEFDHILEAQKKGYLMRQNTKIVIASERVPVDEPMSPTFATELTVPSMEPNTVQTSPRKISQPTWTAEPWNGKTRRKSIRLGGEGSPKRQPSTDPVPPLPGHHSNAVGLGAVAEDELAEEEIDDFEDGAERGRLFVKVVGVKDLQLPFPQQERTQFALTLDNGLHCVTTAWLDLARDAPIGQEFELVVLNDLEFQLTLQMKLEEPKPQRAESPTKLPASPKKQNAFGRLFGSPKKKKESDVRAQQELQAQKRPITPPSAYELVQGLVAKDGSFARAYVACSEYEKQCYGRPATVDIKCFNEWAMESVAVGSSRSKKGAIQLQRRPPYEIGKLELQLLYVPKPKGAKDEDMPKSMNGAIRAMREAEEKAKQKAEIKEFEGFLSQQGGDCPYWRRRFFKLIGSKFTAYHETTRQPRATINLAKASKLIDDKSKLMQKETSTRNGGRRKSGFADDEEGYMFVEEGFRIRFANGEVIDFYADNTAAKEEWMVALSQVVGKAVPSTSSSANSGKSWTEIVLKREKSTRSRSPTKPAMKTSKELPRQPQAPESCGASGLTYQPQQTHSQLPRPSGHTRTESFQENGSISQSNSPSKSRPDRSERHRKTKSMFA